MAIVANLIIFTPLGLMTEITALNSTLTASACMVYFFSRLSHFIFFTFAVPVLRIISLLVGFAMQMILGLHLINLL